MNNRQLLIRGGGDLASGVAARLHRCGFQVLITELAQPLVVRRLVSFAEAVYTGAIQVEELTGRLAHDLAEVEQIFQAGEIAVMVDPDLSALSAFAPLALVDARMMKRPPESGLEIAPLVIGLGPGFTAGKDCHAVIETMRGHTLGRVIWQGQALPNSGIPDTVSGRNEERVLRAPADGILMAHAAITDVLEEGALIAEVEGQPIRAPFRGALRGLVQAGLRVHKGMKVGDLDPRADPVFCTLISDKSLAIGGGVLEAILSQESLRRRFFSD